MDGTRARSRRRLAAFGALVLASAFCLALFAARVRISGSHHHDYLVLNLALAWLPFLFALALYDGARRRASRVYLGTLALLWMLFLPNAPYILTDFVHLEPRPPVPLWFDALLIVSYAFTGLALATGSMLLVHQVARERIGALLSWLLLVPVLLLASLGIYLGRYVRLNSWDAILRPGRVAHVLATPLHDPLAHPRFVAVMVLFTVFLMVAYLLVYTVMELRLAPDDRAAVEDRHRV